jgi:hypothetical protein
VLCAPDIAFDQDGTRQGDAFRSLQHDRYVAELEQRRIPYLLVEGDVARRVDTVATALSAAASIPQV